MKEPFEKVLEVCIEKIEHGYTTIEECMSEYPQYQNELREMLPLVNSLKTLKSMKASRSFSNNARNRLIENLPNIPVTFFVFIRHLYKKPLFYLRRRLYMPQIIISILVVLSLLVGGSYTVQAAGPGDLLYDLDRAIEQTRLRLTEDPLKSITLQLQQATERLEEAETKLRKGRVDDALEALVAYDEALTNTSKYIEDVQNLNRETLRSMIQEELALQQGTLNRIRLSWPEDAQARNAYQNALQRSNMGADMLLGPPEITPKRPSEDAPQGAKQEDAQGPNEEVTQDPNKEAPKGPNQEPPYGPKEDMQKGPVNQTP